MKWRSRAAPRKLWNPVFAWLPVRIGFTWVWLETVDRRWSPPPSGAREEERGRWEYRLSGRAE